MISFLAMAIPSCPSACAVTPKVVGRTRGPDPSDWVPNEPPCAASYRLSFVRQAPGGTRVELSIFTAWFAVTRFINALVNSLVPDIR
jgi:hypothetical protein